MGQIAASRVSCNEVATQRCGVVTRGATRNREEKGRIVRTRSQLREPQRMQGSRVKGLAETQSQVAVCSLQDCSCSLLYAVAVCKLQVTQVDAVTS